MLGNLITMIANMRRLFIILTAALLVGCGGGYGPGSTSYQQAVDAANAMEAQARRLAVDTPCDQPLQCGVVLFTDPKNPCAMRVYQPYSLVSATAAAAKAASDQQLALAVYARELSPQPLVACPAYFALPPGLACVASRCIALSAPPL